VWISWGVERHGVRVSRASSAKRSASACPKKLLLMGVRPQVLRPADVNIDCNASYFVASDPSFQEFDAVNIGCGFSPITRAEGINAKRDAGNLGHIILFKIGSKRGV
jgi:hypothetical protein